MIAPLSIAQVTPFAWELDHEVNRYVRAVSAELAARGHRVLIVAPSHDGELVRAGRDALRGAGGVGSPLPEPGAEPRVLAVGEALGGPQARRAALPIDVSRAIEALHAGVALDLCHVHEPFAPSVSSVSLRHSRALNVGTFHLPTEHVVSTQVARKLVELVFGRLDARTASFAATAALMERFFPGSYRVVHPGADAPAPAVSPAAARAGTPPTILFVEAEERAALRTFLRALRLVSLDEPWEAVVVTERGPSSSTSLRAALRDRVRFVAPADVDTDALLGEAAMVVLASDGAAPAPGLIQRARVRGVPVIAPRLAVYEELLDDDGAGRRFEPRDTDTLAAQITRQLGDPAAPPAYVRPWSAVTDELEEVYAGVVARRHDTTGRPDIRKRIAGRPLIDVDLHMHTDHSSDCATPVEVLLDTARAQGLGAIAVTDHNEVSGAFEAAAKAAEYGVKIIVAEEVKTASQGEVIGLFLKEKIARGMTLQETVAEIKRQGGLVYVPHPFDRMHSVPDYEHLLDIVDDIDAIEVFNPRVAIGSFNEEAQRFAAKYRIVAGAGSDSHVAQGLGSVRIRMRDFDGPDEFLESLREADIVTKPTSLLYVQALKFLETTAIPAGARKARRARRVRRATRRP